MVSSITENSKREIIFDDRRSFSLAKSKAYVDSLIFIFKEHFHRLGYREEKPVKISSGIDSTVRFVGSPINVLKQYLIKREVPYPGVFIHQNCIRTRNANKLLDSNYSPNWGSYFPGIGAITPPERLKEACNETFDFFEKTLLIAVEDIAIRISSLDTDLVSICKERFGENVLEIDTKMPDYYRHKIGIDGVRGRNFNIALRNAKSKDFSDIGNIILFEDGNRQLCVEIALGATTILKQLYGLNHVQDCIPVLGLKMGDENLRRKFEDAITVAVVLYLEKIRPNGQHNRNRLLKKYISSLSYFRAKAGMDIDSLAKVILDFEKREFPEAKGFITDEVINFIKLFEKDLMRKTNLTNSEVQIRRALGIFAE
jgi:hypothetical protein